MGDHICLRPPVARHIHAMDRLPPELWAWVCSLSDIRSLQRIRLVNSTFAQIAARYLFEGLCVTLIPKYLDKVTEVAFHPTLRFYVRTLYFDYKILDQGSAEYDVWEAGIYNKDSFYGEEKTAEDQVQGQSQVAMSQVDLKRHHANFNQLLASQMTCLYGRMDLPMLSAALAMLPNLRAIESMDEAFAHRATPLLSGLQSRTLPRQYGLGRPLASLLCGLGLTRKQIVTMEIDPIPWSFWQDMGPLGFLHDVQQLIHSAFRSLERMRTYFPMDIDDLEFRLQRLLPTSITTFIAAAPRLRSLELSFYCYHGQDDGSDLGEPDWLETSCNAGQVFAALTLPSLVEFSLAYCRLPEKILEDFIARHATTLKEINLSAVALDNGSNESTSWEKTLRLVAPILFLDEAVLWSLHCDDILNVILKGDPDEVARDHRHSAYCQALAAFLLKRGRTQCPRIADYAKQ